MPQRAIEQFADVIGQTILNKEQCMSEEKNLKFALFEQNQLRREWYYSITDVIAILTDSKNPLSLQSGKSGPSRT